jgi:hypothetical protein
MRIRDFPQLALSRSKGYATDGNNYAAKSPFGILFNFDYDILFECLENFFYGRKLTIRDVTRYTPSAPAVNIDSQIRSINSFK